MAQTCSRASIQVRLRSQNMLTQKRLLLVVKAMCVSLSPGISYFIFILFFLSSSVSLVAQSCWTLCHPMDCSTPGLPVNHQLPKFTQLMSTESVMPSNHLILCYTFLLWTSISPSIRVIINESTLCIWWPNYWSFSFSISPSNEHPGL